MSSQKVIKFRARIAVLSYSKGMHYLEVPKHVVKELKPRQRMICAVNGKVKYSCGVLSLGQGRGYIMISKARLKILGLKAKDTAEVVLSPDKSKYGAPMPAELKELLKQDNDGREKFNALTPGKQRNIIFYVGGAKNPERIDPM